MKISINRFDREMLFPLVIVFLIHTTFVYVMFIITEYGPLDHKLRLIKILDKIECTKKRHHDYIKCLDSGMDPIEAAKTSILRWLPDSD